MISNDYFLINKTKPYLIEKNIINKVIKTNLDENNRTYNYIKNILYDFLKKHTFVVGITLLILLFLLYRYFYYYNYSKILNKKIKKYIDNNYIQNNQKFNYPIQERQIIDIDNTNDILQYYN